MRDCQQYLEFAVRDLNVARLQRAWQRLVEHHDMLRVVVLPNGTQQVQAQVPPVTIQVYDCTALGQDEIEAHSAQVRQRLMQHCYTPREWPLFTIAVSLLQPGLARVHLSLDMLIADGHSLGSAPAKLAQMAISAAIKERYPLTMDEYEFISDMNVDRMGGVQDKVFDPISYAAIYDKCLSGRGLLVLSRISNFHHEYRWS